MSGPDKFHSCGETLIVLRPKHLDTVCFPLLITVPHVVRCDSRKEYYQKKIEALHKVVDDIGLFAVSCLKWGL